MASLGLQSDKSLMLNSEELLGAHVVPDKDLSSFCPANIYSVFQETIYQIVLFKGVHMRPHKYGASAEQYTAVQSLLMKPSLFLCFMPMFSV